MFLIEVNFAWYVIIMVFGIIGMLGIGLTVLVVAIYTISYAIEEVKFKKTRHKNWTVQEEENNVD